MQQQFSILVQIAGLSIFACIVTVYFFSLDAIIRATRLPESSRLHPGRARMALILVLMSFLFPVIVLYASYRGSVPNMDDRQWQYDNIQFEQQRQVATKAALEKVLNTIGEKMRNMNVQNQERYAYTTAYKHIDDRIHQLSREQMVTMEVSASSSPSGVSIGATTVFSFLLYAFPGTILGLGYVTRIRRESERPGLVAGLLAALTWPVILILGGSTGAIIVFGFTGFLIVLTIALVGVGIIYAVRYWLSH